VKRLREWAIAALVLVLVAMGAAIAARRSAQARLAERRAVLARLVEEARAATAEAEGRLASGAWDLVAEVPSGLVERILQQFVGYRQRTRRGNVFEVRELETTLHDGYAELRARADFGWRWGLYDGPVEATYYAFARVAGDGGCDLFFRVAEMKTLAPWPLFNRFLEPILTYRLQRSLEIPNLRLPLGLARPSGGDGEWRRRFASGVEVAVPNRPIDLGERRALPLLDRYRLGIVVERPAASPAPDAGGAAGDPSLEEVRVAARLDFISERLAQAVRPADDFTVSLGRLPRVWARRTQGGTDFSADLVNLRGVVDVRDLRVGLAAGGLELDAAVHAVFSGQLEAAVLSIRHALPLRIESALRQRVPLRVVGVDGGLGLQAELSELAIPLSVETRLRSLPLRFDSVLAVPGETLARAVRLPALVLAELRFPVRVERGRVVESKRVPVEIEWTAAVPAAATGALEARGRVQLER
jgi:hypothetical protein